MTSRSHVAIIGAGAIGLAVALQLRRAGVEDVLVIDRNASPGMGSTSRANGGVRAQFSTPINIAFSQYTIHALAELDRATNGLVGLRQVGYLFMVGTERGERALREAYRLQRECGVNVRWLTPDQTLNIVPFVNPEGLRAATFCPTDGIIDPGGVVAALSDEGRRRGVEFLLNHEVRAIGRNTKTVMIETGDTTVESDFVVNAAGPFAQQIAQLAGVDLPVYPVRRNLACTEEAHGFPAQIPMSIDVDTGVLVRREGAGFLLAYSDPADQPSFDTSFDPSFLEALGDRIGHRFPFLESIPINARKCWAGLYPETADHQAIVDGSPDDPRFIHCAGFGGHGIMHSLAAGQAVTELISHGHCQTFDLHPFRLDRFRSGELLIEDAVL